MKAVILAAGIGKRLRPLTNTRPKPLIPIGGAPLLEHSINNIKNIGIKEILLIVGYKNEMIKEYFGDGQDKFGVKIKYVIQEKRLGTAHAAKCCQNFVENKPFLLMNGDVITDEQVFIDVVKLFQEGNCDGIITLFSVENPESFGIISLDEQGYAKEIVEKPIKGLNVGNLANAGIYIFNSKLFDAIDQTKKSIRGEYEITDSFAIMIKKGLKILGYDLSQFFWSDIGLPWQLLDANKFILDKIEAEINGIVEDNVIIKNKVFIGKDTRIMSGTYIEGPVYIGEGNKIGPNAHIRPYSCICNNCHIGNSSEVKNSIAMSNTNFPHFNYVGDSIIGEKVNFGAGTKIANIKLTGTSVKMIVEGKIIDTKRRKLGTIIGDNVKTGISTNIVCGVKVGENSLIGANTLVNEDIPPKSVYYADFKNIILKKQID